MKQNPSVSDPALQLFIVVQKNEIDSTDSMATNLGRNVQNAGHTKRRVNPNITAEGCCNIAIKICPFKIYKHPHDPQYTFSCCLKNYYERK